jgi:hypothetical protein
MPLFRTSSRFESGAFQKYLRFRAFRSIPFARLSAKESVRRFKSIQYVSGIARIEDKRHAAAEATCVEAVGYGLLKTFLQRRR